MTKKPITRWEDLPLLLSTQEAADAMNMHRNSIMKLINEDPTFPARKVRRNWKISREALRSWLAGNDPAEGE